MRNLLIFLQLFVVMMSSCKKFVDIPPPQTQLQSETVFDNDQAAISAMLGIYAQIGGTNLSLLNGAASLYPSFSADELINTVANTDIEPFYLNSLESNHSNLYSRIWQPAYNSQGIYGANSIMIGVTSSNKLTDSTKSQILGEAKVIRALCYFYLVNFFGDVPLVLSTNFQNNSIAARIETQNVYQTIINDLKEAQGLLKSQYPSANRARPNLFAATALLARTFLYNKDWANAEIEATKIIASGVYNLTPNTTIGNAFLISSPETIWQIARDNNNTSIGAALIPTSTTTKPAYTLSNQLLGSFAPSDLRRQNWVDSNKISNVAYYYPKKYKSRLATPITEYHIVFRLAEMYLIRAEARVQQSKFSEAQDDLNRIRNRAGLSSITLASKDQALLAIEKERQLELFAEWGHRWLDLKRTNRAAAVLSSIKAPNWSSDDILYPIPQGEREKNPHLTQNPGY